MPPTRFTLVALLLLTAPYPVFAQAPDLIDADRPGLADTGTVVGKRRWQIETGLQWESRDDETSEFFPVLIRIGLTDRFEARIEGNSFTSAVVDGVRETGLATTSFGGKFVLRDAEARTPGFGVIGRVTPTWGSGGFEAQHVTGDVRLAMDWEFSDHFSLNPNAGIGWYEGESSTFPTGVFALTLAYAPRPGVSLFVDSAVQAPEVENGTASVIVDAGVAYIPRENWQFDISAGTRAHGDTPPRPFIGVGVAFRHK